MNKEQMIEKIYEVISDKTLSFGCLIKSYYDGKIETISDKFGKKFILLETLSDYGDKEDLLDSYEIIGHPVMIGDVLEFSDKLDKKGKRYWYTLCNRIIDLWKDKRKPIDDQSEECIKFIYSLIQ